MGASRTLWRCRSLDPLQLPSLPPPVLQRAEPECSVGLWEIGPSCAWPRNGFPVSRCSRLGSHLVDFRAQAILARCESVNECTVGDKAGLPSKRGAESCISADAHGLLDPGSRNDVCWGERVDPIQIHRYNNTVGRSSGLEASKHWVTDERPGQGAGLLSVDFGPLLSKAKRLPLEYRGNQ